MNEKITSDPFMYYFIVATGCLFEKSAIKLQVFHVSNQFLT